MPYFAGHFLQELAVLRYVQLNRSIYPALYFAKDLGVHTDIIEINTYGTLHLVLSIPSSKPFGKDIPVQCQDCYRINAYYAPQLNGNANQPDSVSIQCGGCKKRHNIKKPDDLRVIKHDLLSSCGEGWYVREVKNTIELIPHLVPIE